MMLRLRFYAWRLGRFRKMAAREWKDSNSPSDMWEQGRALVYNKVYHDLWALLLTEPHAPYHVRAQLREMRRVWEAVARNISEPLFRYDAVNVVRRAGATSAAKDVARKLRGF